MSIRERAMSGRLVKVMTLVMAWMGVVCAAAYASVPPPDPVLQAPPAPVPLTAVPSRWHELHWMLTGVWIVLLLSGAISVTVQVSRRVRVRVRRAGLRRRLGLGRFDGRDPPTAGCCPGGRPVLRRRRQP